jgi:uncharacterized protein (TIGR02301 family)
MMKRIICLIFTLAMLGTQPGFAQKKDSKADAKKPVATEQDAPSPVPLNRLPPPYDGDLQKLLETLGAISYLTALCPQGNPKAAEDWRSKAKGLIDAEAPEGARRTRMIGFYNRGFASYSLIHRRCTDASRIVTTRLLGEAGQLSRVIGSRFGG